MKQSLVFADNNTDRLTDLCPAAESQHAERPQTGTQAGPLVPRKEPRRFHFAFPVLGLNPAEIRRTNESGDTERRHGELTVRNIHFVVQKEETSGGALSETHLRPSPPHFTVQQLRL